MPDFLSVYPMAFKTDFAQQTIGVNAIDDIIIRQTMRIVCYNQPIYDDLRLEPHEYAGLTLGVRMSQFTTVLTEVQPMYDQASILILDDDSECMVDLVCMSLCAPHLLLSLQEPGWVWRRPSSASWRMWAWSNSALLFTVQTSLVLFTSRLMWSCQLLMELQV